MLGWGAMFEMGGCLAWIRYTASLDLPVEVIQDNDDARIEVHRKPVGVGGFHHTMELPAPDHLLAHHSRLAGWLYCGGEAPVNTPR